MRNTLFILFLLFIYTVNAQKKIWARLVINPQLKIDTSFNKNWSYTWYVVKHEDGSFENTLSDSIRAEDTAHYYYTAACTNTHNGNHQINYCKAAMYNDDVELHFSGQPPGYNEEMAITIRKNKFSGQYNFQPLVLEGTSKISFEIISQKLVLKNKPVYDSMITGTIEVRFREKVQRMEDRLTEQPIPMGPPVYSKIHMLKGRFRTRLDEVIDIE